MGLSFAIMIAIAIAVILSGLVWWVLRPRQDDGKNEMPDHAHLITRRIFLKFSQTLRTRLSLMDISQLSTVLSYCFCMDSHLDLEMLLIGLEVTLMEFPQVCSRMEKNEDRSVEFVNRPRSEFDVQVLDLSQTEVSHILKDGTRTFIAKDSIFSPNLTTESILNCPVAMIRISFVLLEGKPKTIICINVNHSVCDGASIIHFMSCWSRFTRGKKTIDYPSHERTVVDSIEAHPIYSRKSTDKDTPYASNLSLLFMWFFGSMNEEQVPYSFFLHQSTIDKLKEMAILEIPISPLDGQNKKNSFFLSSNDIMVAYLWKVLAACAPKQDLDERVGISFVVSCKGKIPLIEPLLFGNAISVVNIASMTRREILEMSFSKLCWNIRSVVQDRVTELELSNHVSSFTSLMRALGPYLAYFGWLLRYISTSKIKYGENLLISNLCKASTSHPIDFGTGSAVVFPRVADHRGYLHGIKVCADDQPGQLCWSGMFNASFVQKIRDVQLDLDDIDQTLSFIHQ